MSYNRCACIYGSLGLYGSQVNPGFVDNFVSRFLGRKDLEIGVHTAATLEVLS